MRRTVTVLVLCVCMSVCLSVTTLAATSAVSKLKMRYVGVYLRLFSVFNSWIFDKSFRSKVMVRKSQYANEQLLFATSFSPFRVLCIHQYVLTGGTLSKRSVFSSLCTSWMLLWCLLLVGLPRSCSVVLHAANLHSVFRGRSSF